jgi:hypothetical protein
MSNPRLPCTHRVTRVIVMWMIALVLPLQGVAVAAFGAMGPAHVHAAPKAALVLEDFRRWKPTAVGKEHVYTALGHFHASAAPQRHHHAADDGSVVRIGTEAQDADEAPGAGALSVLALIPCVARWAPPRQRDELEASPRWAPHSGFIEPLDRPPRQG